MVQAHTAPPFIAVREIRTCRLHIKRGFVDDIRRLTGESIAVLHEVIATCRTGKRRTGTDPGQFSCGYNSGTL